MKFTSRNISVAIITLVMNITETLEVARSGLREELAIDLNLQIVKYETPTYVKQIVK